MSKESGNDKGKQPDYYIKIAKEDRHGKEKLYDFGALWNAKNDYKTGESLAGRVVVVPREELERMRAEQSEAQAQDPSQDLQPKQ